MEIIRPSIGYGAFYAAFCSFLAVVTALSPLYFKMLGFSAERISWLGIAMTVSTIAAPPLCTSITSRSLSPRSLTILLVLLLPAAYLLVFAAPSFGPFLFVWCLFFLILRGVVAMVELAAIREDQEETIVFGKVRLWGTLGFAASSAVGGWAMDRYGPGTVPFAMGALIPAIALPTLLLVGRMAPHNGAKTRNPTRGGALRGNRPLHLLLGINLLMWGSHSVSGLYLSLYLEALGWSKQWIGGAWMLTTLSELVVFLLFERAARRFSGSSILIVSAFGGVVRWTMLAATEAAPAIIVANLFHALSFAASYLVSLKLAHLVLEDHDRDRGQGLLMAAGPGAGILVGNAAAGIGASMVGEYRDIRYLYWGAALMATTAFLLALELRRQLRRVERGEEPRS